ncbi:MAG: hypothetical protein K2W82_16220 [Candidatus Obscuribacterales bacterium]|nr:hypothetical protein [Candidatus Obscuribacterales bacterium]
MKGFSKDLFANGVSWRLIYEIPLFLIAGVIYAFVESARSLTKHTYGNGWEALFLRLPFGSVLSFAAAASAGHYVGWTLGAPTWQWLLAGFGAMVGTFLYGWPALYLVAVRPVWKLAELLWAAIRRGITQHAERFFKTVLSALGYACPGSHRAWDAVLNKHSKSWAGSLAYGLTYASALYFAWKLGWTAYAWVGALLPASLPVVAWVLATAGGLLAFLMLAGTAWQLVEYGKLPFLGLLAGTGAGLLFAGAFPAMALGGILVGILTATYGFPLTILLLSGELIKQLIKKIEQLAELCYSDKDKDYVLFFQHVTNFGLTVGAGYLAQLVCVSLGLTPVYAWAITGIAALIAYNEIYDAFGGSSSGNGLLGTFSGLAAAWFAGKCYFDAGLTGGIWLAVPLALLAGLIQASVVFPTLYVAARFVLRGLGAGALGQPLDRLHKAVDSNLRKATRWLGTVYNETYKDNSGYQAWFLQVTNLAATVGTFLAVKALFAPGLLTTISSVFAAYVVYNLFGQLFKGWRGGVPLVGTLAAFAGAIFSGAYVYSGGYSLWLVVICALTGGSITYSFLFPLAYMALRLPAKPLLASWSTSLLERLHEISWSVFSVVWDKIMDLVEVIIRIMAPFWKVFANAFAKVGAFYRQIRDRLNRR